MRRRAVVGARVDPRSALCIARRESGLLPWAESATGSTRASSSSMCDYWDSNYDTYASARLAAEPQHPERPHERDRLDPHGHDIGWGPWGGQRLRLSGTADSGVTRG